MPQLKGPLSIHWPLDHDLLVAHHRACPVFRGLRNYARNGCLCILTCPDWLGACPTKALQVRSIAEISATLVASLQLGAMAQHPVSRVHAECARTARVSRDRHRPAFFYAIGTVEPDTKTRAWFSGSWNILVSPCHISPCVLHKFGD